MDWDQIVQQYQQARLELEPFEVPNEQELSQHKLQKSRTPNASSTLELKIAWGRRFPSDGERAERLRDFNTALQSAYEYKFSDLGNCFEVIDNALRTRQLDLSFAIAWSYLWTLVGRQTELLHDDHAIKEFNRKVRSGAHSGNLAQRCWYAKLVLNHTPTSRKKRDLFEPEISEYCLSIVRQERNCPTPFEPEWFSKLISIEDRIKTATIRELRAPNRPLVAIRTAISKKGFDVLRDWANESIDASALPPLHLK